MKPFVLQQGPISILPVVHYRMEMATLVRQAYLDLRPDCVAVELPETMELQFLHAASRLPDLSVVCATSIRDKPLFFMSEPCDPAFEGLRSALEDHIPAHCIDLDIDCYPDINEPIPDPYAITRIGHEAYYTLYRDHAHPKTKYDHDRERYMAKRLKELSFSFDRILFITGMAHAEAVLKHSKATAFPPFMHAKRDSIELATLTEESAEQVMAENSWVTEAYEEARLQGPFPPDRQQLILNLYKKAADNYITTTGNTFPGYHLRTLMKFARNYSLITGNLTPDTFQVITSAKGCVDHNYAYEVWQLLSDYAFLRNVDGLPALNLSPEEVWGRSKRVYFHLKEKNKKGSTFQERKKKADFKFQPPSPFSICSYPPEDVTVENFGDFLKKKGTQILTEEDARTVPFSTSLEDGIDTRETIRHWHEKKLYVRVKGKPPGGVGSVVVIFDEDNPEEEQPRVEHYPWRTTWMGEHEQESDMAFYATDMSDHVVGPGISRCEYGGFLMSYPPRRMYNVWIDPDYEVCRSKAEVLLAAGIDYAVKPIIVYVAAKPPRPALKSFASRFGKKIVYIPIGQLSPVTLNRIRAFHVLDGHDKRNIADEYIY